MDIWPLEFATDVATLFFDEDLVQSICIGKVLPDIKSHRFHVTSCTRQICEDSFHIFLFTGIY